MAASEFCRSMSALIKSVLRLLIVLDPLKQISAGLNIIIIIIIVNNFFYKNIKTLLTNS